MSVSSVKSRQNNLRCFLFRGALFGVGLGNPKQTNFLLGPQILTHGCHFGCYMFFVWFQNETNIPKLKPPFVPNIYIYIYIYQKDTEPHVFVRMRPQEACQRCSFRIRSFTPSSPRTPMDASGDSSTRPLPTVGNSGHTANLTLWRVGPSLFFPNS